MSRLIENGTLQPFILSRGFLVNGNPVAPVGEWGEPILANIRTNNKASVGKVNGNTFTAATYEVLIDETKFDAARVRLFRGEVFLGEFSILSIEPLEAVGLIKITV